MSNSTNHINRPYHTALTECINTCNQIILILEDMIDAAENQSSYPQGIKQIQNWKKKIENYLSVTQEDIKNHPNSNNNDLIKNSITKAESLIKKLGEVERAALSNSSELEDACNNAIEMADELLENCENILG